MKIVLGIFVLLLGAALANISQHECVSDCETTCFFPYQPGGTRGSIVGPCVDPCVRACFPPPVYADGAWRVFGQ